MKTNLDKMAGLLAIIIPAVIALGALAVAKISPDGLSGFMFVLLIILVVGSAVVGVLMYNDEKKQTETPLPQVELPIRAVTKVEYPPIALGTAKAAGQGRPEDVIVQAGLDPISIWLEDGKLKISTVIRDEKGQQIARLDANQFMVTRNGGYDINYDSSGLEVIDAQRKVILQVEIKEGVAQLKGIFHDRTGWAYALGEKMIEKRPPGTPLEITFKPLFVHPGYKDLGGRLLG